MSTVAQWTVTRVDNLLEADCVPADVEDQREADSAVRQMSQPQQLHSAAPVQTASSELNTHTSHDDTHKPHMMLWLYIHIYMCSTHWLLLVYANHTVTNRRHARMLVWRVWTAGVARRERAVARRDTGTTGHRLSPRPLCHATVRPAAARGRECRRPGE